MFNKIYKIDWIELNMVKKTYIVCDMSGVFEQGNENIIIYVREVSPADVQPVRIAQRELEGMLREYAQKVREDLEVGKLPESSASEDIFTKMKEKERGKFAGLYLVKEYDFTLPEIGFTYHKIPAEWEKVEGSSKQIGSETTLEEFLKERWWNLDKS